MANNNDVIASLSGTLSFTVKEVMVKDYNLLENLPTINGHVVKGDMTQDDLDIKGGGLAKEDPENPEHIIFD